MLKAERAPRNVCSWFILLTIILALHLGGCGGGSNGVPAQTASNALPPDQPGLQIRTETGRIQLASSRPAGSGSLTVSTDFGDSPVSAAGSFAVPINQSGVQVVMASDAQGNPVALAFAGDTPTSPLVLNEHTTAVGLVALNSMLAASDSAGAQHLRQMIESLPETVSVEDEIKSQLAAQGTLNPGDPALASAVSNAVLAAAKMAARGTVTQARAISPTGSQSGILIANTSDTNPSSVALTAGNYLLRYVELWEQPVDAQGNAVGQETDLGLIPSADDESLGQIVGSLFTGQIYGESETPVTVSIPSPASAVQVRAWGPGWRNGNSVTSGDWASHAAGAAFATAFVDGAGPTVDAFVGVKLLTRGQGRPTNVFRTLENASNKQQMLSIAQELQNGQELKATYDALTFAIDSDSGRSLLLSIAQAAGIKGLSQKALKRLVPWLRLAGLGQAAFETGRLLGSLSGAQPLETFRVTSSQSNSVSPFKVTLSWNQADDLDLHTVAPDGEHSYYANKAISEGSLDLDNTTGFGPEDFIATSLVPGRYHIAVNYYGNGQVPTAARIHVTTASGSTNFGPYTLAAPNGNMGYPVLGNTNSWWRPCDIQVNADGTVNVMSPDTSVALPQLTVPLGRSSEKNYKRL